MNIGLYKLVYSKVLNMMVPVSEAARGHTVKSSRRVRKHTLDAFNLTILTCVALVSNAWGDTTLPAGVSIRAIVDNSTRVISSDANSINFQQLKANAIVDFNQLNLTRGQNFNVDMRPTWSMLSRVHDINGSVLNGNVNAAGNLYFVNANGIVIGKDAQFNVGSLYAGTLDITNTMFQDGFVNQESFTKAFELVGTLDLDDAARAKIENAQVLVEGGARINTANNGKVMLFAPNVKVEEGAIIRTPEGQTILAAGKKIYLKGSTDPAGFLVEVDAGGTATNLGKIVAERGNITMMGLAVNQSGTLSATTSVRANGTIKLIAQDKVDVSGIDVTGRRNGMVTLSEGSVTEITPELTDKEETIASQPFKTSEVNIEASLIHIDGAINVQGGNVTANTNVKTEYTASPELNSATTRRIYLGEHASIDVSGVDAVAPMSRNQLVIQLFSDQLKDAPILRDSDLFRSTVYVDARKGTDLFDIQPFLDLRGATVGERMTSAGTVTLATNQELIISKGSVIDVSGGSTTYEAGTVKETQLLFNGRLVPISEALPGVAYNVSADTLSVRDAKWGTTETYNLGGTSRFVQSYFEGADAGTVNLTTNVETDRNSVLVLAGNLIANTRVSREQLLNQTAPLGGKLIASANTMMIENEAKSLADGFSFDDEIADASTFVSVINAEFLDNGFNRIDFTKVDDLTVNTALNLDSHGSLTLGNAGTNTVTRLNANITAPSSDIHLQSLTTQMADNIAISTAGVFTNDRAGIAGALTREVSADGGNITAGVLRFGNNVKLDASAGAWVDSQGKFHAGEAGDIGFVTNQNLPSNLTLQSYGFTHGGTLSIQFGDGIFSNLNVATASLTGSDDFSVGANFFKQGGFSDYALSAFNVNIGHNSEAAQEIYAAAQNWKMDSGFLNMAGGQSMSVVAKPITLPEYAREAVSFSFTSNSTGNTLGSVTLAENTTLRTDRGGSVSLTAGKQVNVLGDIVTPSGNINLKISINEDDILLPEDATQMVYIGENATLSAKGSTITYADSRAALLHTQVVDAGQININQNQGATPKGAVVIKEGALLDVSGAAIVNDTKTTKGYVRETLFGDAGTVNINGTGAMLLDGSFKADATGTGRDGSLNLVFNATPFSDVEQYPNNSGTLIVTEEKQLASLGLGLGSAIKDNTQSATAEATQYLKAQISANQIEQAGFANVSVRSYLKAASASSKVELADNLTLNIAGNLTFDTPVLHVQNNGNATLNAGHITLKSPTQFFDTSVLSADTGMGTLTANAQQVYIDGVTAITGVNQTNLNAAQDIHGQGVTTIVQIGNTASDSGLMANGNMTLTARQIYPDSGAKLTFEAVGSNSNITINASSQAAKPVLSSGGTLTIKANDIVQNGALTAPFGSINLVGENSVTLTANSTTSVSANNMVIPYGVTTTGGETFNPSAGVTRNLPESGINIDANNVDMQTSAVLDLSAGGDMFAYEWVAGIGGSKDVLAQPNTYAVIPNYNQAFAPTDLNMAGNSAQVGVGQTVYLNGVDGLATGTYTLLPARYALVPGAFVVQLKPTATLLPGQVSPQQDGSTLTTGYFAELATGARDAQLSTFNVYNGAVFRPEAGTVSRAPSQYILTSANTFFNNPLTTGGLEVNTPQDVARLSLSATQLILNADVMANKQQGGRGLLVDISSDNIRVVSEQDTSDTTSLQLTASGLNGLGAESVLLGGTRSLVNGTTQITTVASTVSIENDADHVLSTTEFIAAATQQVQVNADAVVDTGTASTKPTETLISTSGDGALLALSSKNDLRYTRQGSSALATQGEVNVAEGSQLSAGNAAVVDGSKNVNLNGSLVLQDGGSATLGANRILIGDAPADIAGLNVSNASLAALGKLSALTLNSYSNIDTFGTVNFGNQGLDLTLNSAGIVGHAGSAPSGSQNSVITANTLTLKNTQDATLIASADPATGLTLNANVVRFEGEQSPVLVNNAMADTDKTSIQGYTNLAINAGDIRVAKQGETVLDVAQTTLTAGRISAETGADYKIKATGELSTLQATSPTTQESTLFGGKLALEAQDMIVASRLQLAAGQLTLKANNDLTLASGAEVSTSSQAIKYDTTIKHMAAGQVNLISTTGNVNVNSGARVDVSSQGDANAGTVSLQASQGTVNLAGTLDGAADGTGLGGKLKVDVGTLSNLSATNQQAVGFTEARSYRVRNGDVAIIGTGPQALAAREVNVTADAGQLNVSGEINATATKNSHIGLYAANGLTLESTAKLTASSTNQGEEGGRVDLHTVAGNLDLKAGASVNVSGGLNGAGGEVHLRAPRTGAGSGTGVAVTQLASDITGAQSIVLEAVRTYSGVNTITTGSGTGATLGFTTVANDVTNFMGNQATILAALGKTDDSRFHLQAGTEIRSNGNLTVASDWNLYNATRAGNEPGVLTLRAAGNIQFTGSLSDGFTTANRNLVTQAATDTTPAQGLQTDKTWSYRLASGADMQSANVMNTMASEQNESGTSLTGNLVLNNDKVIRTGTGFIEIATGGDLQMKNSGSVIYTVGRVADTLTGFDGPTGANANALYLTDGGDISIHTQGNIIGAEIGNNRQVVNQWLFRQGSQASNKDTSWWVRPDLFKQSLATLGGGDITLEAGGDISNFSASAPTTARFDNVGTVDDPATQSNAINGGGDLLVSAGGNITNGTYYVAKGDGVISADGNIQKTEETFGTLLALQDGSVNLQAGKDAYIGTTFNPTLTSQATANAGVTDNFGVNSYFNTYSELASVTATSVNGNLTYGNGDDVYTRTTGLDRASTIGLFFGYNPARLDLTAHAGDLTFGSVGSVNSLVILPASNGQLSLLAANDIRLGNVNMSDADPLSLAGTNSPISVFDGFANKFNRLLNSHSPSVLHAEDNVPALIVANTGDISSENRVIAIPKATRLVAGNDITNLNIALQNNSASDISLIKAGRDVKTQNIVVGGPGELLVQAGRNVDLIYTLTTTINTTGNTGTSNAEFKGTFARIANTALPTQGASITLQAGLGQGADVNAYVTQYILPTGTGPETLAGNPAKLAEYWANTAIALTAYMRKLTGDSTLTDAQALSLFTSQSVEAKTIFANRHLTTELIGSARDFAKAGNHDRGTNAIATLFPTQNEGDILLFNSKVSTNSGGSVDLIAPGGLINVGVPGQGGDIGIITEKGGEIRAIADGDFQVNQSKVITQFGSDIAIWSTNGTIDAGRGSKTATSIPERIVQTDAFGNTIIEVRGVAAGSGIRAQSYDPDGPNGPKTEPKKGNVYLTAPTVDAGEAGIEAGDLLIVAPIVLNATNIQVQGASSGVPVAATSSLAGVSAGLSPDAVNSATQAVAQSVAQSASNSFVKPKLPSIISVDVISIGQ